MTAAALQPTHTLPGVAGARGYRVEILDVSGVAAEHIEAFSGLEALDAAQAAYPSALGFTVSAVVDRR